jgi:hypothetical protein
MQRVEIATPQEAGEIEIRLPADKNSEDGLDYIIEELRGAGLRFVTRTRTRDSVGAKSALIALIVTVGPPSVRARHTNRIHEAASGARLGETG